jgi:hypothetical protein
VFCQLETLRNCLPQNVRRVLKELPKSLDGTYERMLKEIGKVNPFQAYRLLQCLAVATRPLFVKELAEVLAVDFDGAEDGIPALNKDWRWDDEKQGVLSTCSSLITVVRQQRFNYPDGFSSVQVVQFAHFSVKEFLTSDRLASLEADLSCFHIRLEPAHAVITQACLAVLLQSDSNDKVDAISPLHQYAARHWVDHAQFENVSLLVEDGMRRLFDPSKPYLAGWLQLHNMDKEWHYFISDSSIPRPSPRPYNDYTLKPTFYIGDFAPLSLYHASLCGFPDLVKYLISEYPQHVNAAVGFNKRRWSLRYSTDIGESRRYYIKMAQTWMLQHSEIALHYMRHRTTESSRSHDGYLTTAQIRTHEHMITPHHFTWRQLKGTLNLFLFY